MRRRSVRASPRDRVTAVRLRQLRVIRGGELRTARDRRESGVDHHGDEPATDSIPAPTTPTRRRSSRPACATDRPSATPFEIPKHPHHRHRARGCRRRDAIPRRASTPARPLASSTQCATHSLGTRSARSNPTSPVIVRHESRRERSASSCTIAPIDRASTHQQCVEARFARPDTRADRCRTFSTRSSLPAHCTVLPVARTKLARIHRVTDADLFEQLRATRRQAIRPAPGVRGGRPMTTTECPHDARSRAAALPAGPAPIMATSTIESFTATDIDQPRQRSRRQSSERFQSGRQKRG